MADDDIDVEGEFDLKTELGEEFYDTNELPSKSANLLPEFTSPAWMLEQGWSLDSCMDEKSKATIEKMLLEEQQYMCGRKTSRYLSIQKNVLLVTAGSSKMNTPNRSPWTPEEKNTFLQGLGIFGRSWSKIASLIPTRTSLQVKNYAQQYMKNLAKKKAEVEKLELETFKSMTESPLYVNSSLAATVASVTTGQPTITTNSKPKLSSSGAVHLGSPSKQCFKPNKQAKKVTVSVKKVKNKGAKGNKSKKNSSKNEQLCTLENLEAIKTCDSVTIISSRSHKKGSVCSSICSTSDGLSGLNGNSDISNSSFTKESKLSEEEDDELDVDIENDDDENPILQSRSASPSSVYEQLLKSAYIVKENSGKETNTKSVTPKKPSSHQGEECADKVCLGDTKDPDLVAKTEEESSSNETFNKLDSLSDDSSKDKTYEEEVEHCVKTETIVNGLVTSSGEVVEFDIPQEEKILAPTFISEEEKTIHADFFDGRPPKTPERYLKIRSYIIDYWLKCKPNYLNKTCIRPGLKNCGDVNCIGRIHSYLECIGAINFGCEQVAHRNPHKSLPVGTNGKVKGPSKDLVTSSFPILKSEVTRSRKRRIRNDSGLWVDEKELEGKTINHNNEKVEKKAKVPRVSKVTYNPFKLVPCLKFSEEKPAPCTIEMFNTALAIMDIHAHISKTEVIGMLGGSFCSKTGLLTISMAIPCKSMSTGMQCEMDPVSQTLASDKIEDMGMSVVGWYHSHPTFSPDPSVRDIETQQKFQYWFSKGGNHFVGVIISPYNSTSVSVCSDINCLTISDTHSKDYSCNLPYKFDYTVVYRNSITEILGPANELAEKYSSYVNRVKLSCLYKSSLGITCLSKMLQSVKRFLDPSFESTIRQNEPEHGLPICVEEKSQAENVIHYLEQTFSHKFANSH
ncbi:histone H2A deubiquitinase MYSM1-like [Biomphalaria glabrata]|uniref:Myb-like, SWIRM and MPN domain-containing protein 1 n=1 Tax=Biomphalaria glabrata TaxID=6526 RepID=A0A9W3AFS3_BIOGL|nr:histone H2A deubiquitinase MYSM1-like [Biomphalaria glabrata]